MPQQPASTQQMALIMVLFFKLKLQEWGAVSVLSDLLRHLSRALSERGYWGWEGERADAATTD